MTPRLLTSTTGGSASGPVSFGRWNDLSLVLSADTHPPEQAIVSGSSMSLHTWNLSSGSRPSTAPTHNCYSGSVAAAYERRSLGIGSHWLFESWGRFLPEYTTPSACSTCSCTGLSRKPNLLRHIVPPSTTSVGSWWSASRNTRPMMLCRTVPQREGLKACVGGRCMPPTTAVCVPSQPIARALGDVRDNER